MNHTNTAFVKTIRTKPLKSSDKAQHNGKQWKRTSKRLQAA